MFDHPNTPILNALADRIAADVNGQITLSANEKCAIFWVSQLVSECNALYKIVERDV